MRILAVCNRYMPAVSGFEIHLSQILDTLTEMGHKADVLTLNVLDNPDYYRHRTVLPARGTESGISVTRAKCISLFAQQRIFRLLEPFNPYIFGYNKLLSLQLIAKIMDNADNYDVILTGTMPFTQVMYPALKAGKMKGKKTVIMPLIHFGPPHHDRFKYEYFSKKCIELYNMADSVIVNSDIETDFLRRNGFKGSIIQVNAYIERPDSMTAKEGFDILSMGYHNYEKGFETTLNAFEMFSKEVPESHLYVAGSIDPSYHDRLKGMKNVICTGTVLSDEKKKLLSRCSVMVQPSIAESYGMASAEAHAFSMPTINAYCSGSMHLIHEGKNGFLVHFQDHYAVFERLMRLYRDKQMYVRMSEYAYKCSEDYTEQRHRRQCKLLEEALL